MIFIQLLHGNIFSFQLYKRKDILPMFINVGVCIR